MDANFFFERAVHSLERHHYDKALKYFRLAVEKEPANPVNYCNLAGVLSEMGRFEESNEVLRHVTQHVDPDLVECYFYMANNAANMESFEEAEKYILRYLQADPDGEFAQESSEMLDMIALEMGRTPLSPEDVPYVEWMEAHERARTLLENGQFTKAREQLQKLVADYPDCVPGRNNLALAYYYSGDCKRAIQEAEELLSDAPGNLHALCNLAVFYYDAGATERLTPIVNGLKKCIPLEREALIKQATTMGIVHEHEAAYDMFHRLLKYDWEAEPALLHNAAAAAFNTERFHIAERYWKQVERVDSTAGIAAFYLSQLPHWRALDSAQRPRISYHYYLPFEEQFRALENDTSLEPEQFCRDPLIRASFFWALRHGDYSTKLKVIQALGWIGDEDVENVLREFLLDKKEDDTLKRIALFVLRQMHAEGDVAVWLNGKQLTVNPSEVYAQLPVWRRSWQAVIDSALRGMELDYDVIQQHDVEALWVEYLHKVYPDVPTIRKAEGWAAALEYLVARMYGHAITQGEIAAKYAVSPATVGRHARDIEAVCGVFHRMAYRVAFPFHDNGK